MWESFRVSCWLDDRVVNKEATSASKKLVHFTKHVVKSMEGTIVIARNYKRTLLKLNTANRTSVYGFCSFVSVGPCS